MSTLLRPFEQSKSLTIAAAVVFAGVAAFLDVLTARQGSLALLYLPSVFLVSWYVGLQPAVWFSFVCALLPLIKGEVSAERQLSAFDAIWGPASHCILLVVFAVVLSLLRQARRRERELERSDFLTGLANSKSFLERAEAEMRQSRQSRQPITIAFVDCDDFKQINDTLGHLVGDQLLKSIAATLQSGSRNGDLVARLGGDEFAILLPQTTDETATVVIREIRGSLLAAMRENEWPVTFSIGVVTYTAGPESVTEMIRAADETMYSVKRAGKNAVRHQSLPR